MRVPALPGLDDLFADDPRTYGPGSPAGQPRWGGKTWLFNVGPSGLLVGAQAALRNLRISSCTLKSQRQTTQTAVHFLKLTNLERDGLITQPS